MQSILEKFCFFPIYRTFYIKVCLAKTADGVRYFLKEQLDLTHLRF